MNNYYNTLPDGMSALRMLSYMEEYLRYNKLEQYVVYSRHERDRERDEIVYYKFDVLWLKAQAYDEVKELITKFNISFLMSGMDVHRSLNSHRMEDVDKIYDAIFNVYNKLR